MRHHISLTSGVKCSSSTDMLTILSLATAITMVFARSEQTVFSKCLTSCPSAGSKRDIEGQEMTFKISKMTSLYYKGQVMQKIIDRRQRSGSWY